MKKISLVMLLLSLLLIISACSNEGEPATTAEPSDNVVTEESIEESEDDTSKNTDVVSDRLSAAYVDMMKSESYTMKYRTYLDFEGEEVEANVSMFISKGRMAFQTIMENVNTITVMQDEKAYFIDHETQTVMIMPFSQNDIVEDGPQVHNIETETMEYVGSGTGEFLGETMNYEEYTSSGQDRILYYFDGDELIGMEMFFENGSVVMIIEEFTDQVDESMFEIPEDYQVMEIGS